MSPRDFSVVFAHGLAKKPVPKVLEDIWRWGLARQDPNAAFPSPNPGIDLNDEGIPAVFSYFADVFYGSNYETELDSYYEAENAILHLDDIGSVAGDLPEPVPANEREAQFLQKLQRKLDFEISPEIDCTPSVHRRATGAGHLEIAAWLPRPFKEAILKRAVAEAYYFLFDKDYVRADGIRFRVRQELRRRLIADLQSAEKLGGKIVLVAHSMGSMIGYDVLRNCPECPVVDCFFTLGSPLGVREVQDELRAAGRARADFPAARLRRWINVYDPLDPVCAADPNFSRDFESVAGRCVEDLRESNWGNWRHTITHYLAGPRFRTELARALNVRLQ